MTRKQYFLTIDIGGSNIKCAIFDEEGNELSAASAIPETSYLQGGRVERSGEAVWQCCCSVIQAALKQSCLTGRDIDAVSMCGYGGGLCLCDSSGHLVRPIIVSTDTRTSKEITSMKSSGNAARIFSISHQFPWEGQAAPLLRWLILHEPDTLRRARYALCIKDYVRLCLTGEISGEITDLSNLNILDPVTKRVSPELLRLGSISDLEHLFDYPVNFPHTLAGKIHLRAAKQTGLQAGIPVAAGLYDVSACTMGCGCLDSHSTAVTLGTWAMAARFDADYIHTSDSTIVTVSAMKNRFLLEQGSATGTANLNWFLRNILSPIHPNLDSEGLYNICSDVISEKAPQDRSVIFVPYLFASCGNANAKGGFFNVSAASDISDMLYAVLEGILFSALHHISLLQGNRQSHRTVLAGGVAASKEWRQLFCDILQEPVHIMHGKQQGARGAAMCAGIMSGTFSSYYQASEAMAKEACTLFPRPEYKAVFSDKLSSYERVLNSLDEYYNER